MVLILIDILFIIIKILTDKKKPFFYIYLIFFLFSFSPPNQPIVLGLSIDLRKKRSPNKKMI